MTIDKNLEGALCENIRGYLEMKFYLLIVKKTQYKVERVHR